MIVAVDARNVYRPRRRGIGKTLLQTYRHLAALRPNWQFILFHQQDVCGTAECGTAGLPRRSKAKSGLGCADDPCGTAAPGCAFLPLSLGRERVALRSFSEAGPGLPCEALAKQGEGEAVLHPALGFADAPLADLPNVQRRRIDIPGDRWDLWQHLRLPLAARAARADILHCPANTAPRFAGLPLVVTIHDLIPLENPTPADTRWGKNVSAAAKNACAILTPSRHSAQLIARTFDIAADKIIVCPWAADSACRRIEDPQILNDVRARYGLRPDQPYILALGGADPRKNSAGILKAWSLLDESLRRTFRLLLVGIEGRTLNALTQQAQELNLAESSPSARLCR